MQPVCLLLRPLTAPGMPSRTPRAPPSVPTEGLALRSQSVSTSDGTPDPEKKSKFSFHLSKLLLFVKNKNERRSFFPACAAERPVKRQRSVGCGWERAVPLVFLQRNILFFASNARENCVLRKKTLQRLPTVLILGHELRPGQFRRVKTGLRAVCFRRS